MSRWSNAGRRAGGQRADGLRVDIQRGPSIPGWGSIGKLHIPTLIFGFVVSFLLILVMRTNMVDGYQARASLEGETKLYQFQQAINLCESAARGMTDVLIANDGQVSDFDETAARAMEDDPTICAIALAPDGLVTNMYPADASLTFGENLMASSQMADFAQMAQERGQSVVGMPLKLMDGTTVVPILRPIYIGEGDDRRFWGLSVVEADLEALMKSANFSSMNLFGYRYTFSAGPEDNRTVIAGEDLTSVNPQRTVFSSVDIGGSQWNLLVNLPVRPIDQVTGVLVLILAVIGSVLVARIVGGNRSLRESNHRDPLTGCLNRRGFDETIRALQSDVRLTRAYVVAMDVDKFKSFNDRYGHSVGDALLKAFARELEDLVGEDGIVCRNGGDEFQAFLRNPGDEWRGRLEKFFERKHAFHAGDDRYEFNVSGGLAIYPDTSDDFLRLYRKADVALYHAKGMGGHRLAVFDDRMENEPRKQMGFSFADLAGGAPASVLIYRSDPSEEILYANDSCLSLFGCENMREFMELTDGSFRTLVHPDDVEKTEREIAAQQTDPANRGVDRVAYRIVDRDGGTHKVFDVGQRIEHEYYGEVYYVLLWDYDFAVGGVR